jgi:hypothetical protein
MPRVFILSAFLLLNLSAGIPSCADVIYQSGSLGTTGIAWEQLGDEVLGSNISWFNFVGARFEITHAMRTTQIGGHFVGGYEETSFFGAIVALTGSNDFPNSEDLSTPDVMGVSILNFPHASAETRGDISVRLEPGWYALAFGTQLFGTNGRGATIRNGLDFTASSYIVWQDDPGWFNYSELSGANQPANQRFFVEGTLIPEPTTGTILIFAFWSLAWVRLRRSSMQIPFA